METSDPALDSMNSTAQNYVAQTLASAGNQPESTARVKKLEPQVDAQDASAEVLASPSSAFLMPKVDSSDTMVTVKNLNLMNPSIIVHVCQRLSCD